MRTGIGKVWIGTSNGYMPGNKFTFPPEYQLRTRLHYYSTLLNSIEVNGSFYKTPLKSTYEKWASDVPEDFQFTLKLSRDITHDEEFNGDSDHVRTFMQAATGIGNKKGCILIQFPGKINIAYFTQVEQILGQLRSFDPFNEWRIAVEFRNDNWYISETNELLNEYDATMVMHDFSKGRLSTVDTSANFVFMRFHGPAGDYRDSYSDQFLDEKAQQIYDYTKSGKDVYAYFNNTIGNAFENARYLQLKVRWGWLAGQ